MKCMSRGTIKLSTGNHTHHRITSEDRGRYQIWLHSYYIFCWSECERKAWVWGYWRTSSDFVWTMNSCVPRLYLHILLIDQSGSVWMWEWGEWLTRGSQSVPDRQVEIKIQLYCTCLVSVHWVCTVSTIDFGTTMFYSCSVCTVKWGQCLQPTFRRGDLQR